MTFSRPFIAYKPTCYRYCFYYYYCRRRLSPYTARIDLAATPYINLAATYYRPPYCAAARSWPYYYRPPYYRVARSRFYRRRL